MKLDFLSRQVDQLGFVVEDVEQTVQNYYERFGIGDWHFYTYQKPFVPYMTWRGNPGEYSMRVALSYFGKSRVELIQPLSGETVYKEFVERRGYGLQHLGIVVENIKQRMEEARAAGIEVIMEGAGFGPDGDGHYAYLDTEKEFGVMYELIERPKRRHPPEKIFMPSGGK